MVSSRSMRRQFPELSSFPVVNTCPFVYSNWQLASNVVNSIIVVLILHVVHLVDRHCWSRQAAQEYLITSEIGSTDLPLKLRQRDVLNFHVAALLMGDTILCVEIIEGVGIILGMCQRA